jgi:hypothetical protein
LLIKTLRTKAKNNTLEVEHILAAAKAGTPGLRDELCRLAQEFDWSTGSTDADSTHLAPLAKWAGIAGAYAEEGMQSLAVLAQDAGNEVYVIGLLEQLGSLAAVDALIDFYPDAMRNPADNNATAWRLAGACNQLLGFKDAPVATATQASTICLFLMALLPLAESTAQRACVICALRGVGDKAALDYLSALDDLPDPYKTARRSAIRAIRQRQAA